MTTWDKHTEDQKHICDKYSIRWAECKIDLFIGLADNVLTGMNPVNGLRQPGCDRTTGWYIWAGEEFSQAEDFFKPYHVSHLLKLRPDIVKYLGLPPGFRFLMDDKGYEDVWGDLELLNS
jgi:hypothetical protein